MTGDERGKGKAAAPRFPVDAVISSSVSNVMRSIRSRGTKPELAVRRLLHRMGYRFRLHRRDLPGTPDIVLPRHKLAIFVHGCFWHQHSGCRHGRVPKPRREYWLPKLSRTQERDAVALTDLEALGWRSLVIWECAVKDDDALRRALLEKLCAHSVS